MFWLNSISTLFPYTTLFRSRIDEVAPNASVILFTLGLSAVTGMLIGIVPAFAASRPHVQNDANQHAGEGGQSRSEEHTSEIQSLAYLACRLLALKNKELPR